MPTEWQSVPQSATGKALSPMVERRLRRTASDDVETEQRRWWPSTSEWWNSSARYGGAIPV